MAEARFAAGIYLRLVRMSLRAQLQYRRGFALQLLGNFLITFIEFGGLLIFFSRFPRIGDWYVGDVAVLYGLSSMSFSLGEMLGDGFNSCAALVRSGDFDRLLLRPAGTFLQMLGAEFQLRRLGRCAQGLIALVFGLLHTSATLDATHLAIVPPAVLCGAIIYMSLFVLQATFCFWTTEGIEVANMLTNGGQYMTCYPLEIFPSAMRALFTFVVPLAFVSYFPAIYLLHKPDGLGLPRVAPALAPATAIVFLTLALRIWAFGVRHYRSTGS